MDDKKEIRKIYKEIRAKISPKERRQQEEACLVRLQNHPRFLAAKNIFLYSSFGAEFPTEEIAALASSLGKGVAYPKVEERRMSFYQADRLEQGFKGIFEPVNGKLAIPQKGDLMLLPGLAFTKEGGRLGYGGGYYDRYLAACKEKPFLMGLCYSFQIAEELPLEPFDIKVQDLL